MSAVAEWGPVTRWVQEMPKAELHLHIDGSLQAPRMLQLAEKHGVSLPYGTVAEVEAAYDFSDLQSFLDLYYLGASVLRDAEDFYFLMRDYLEVCREQHIVHCEIMVEPQTYSPQGVALGTVLEGFDRAINEAALGWGQSVVLILSFLRHLPEDDCLQMLEQARPYRKHFVAIGLASAERDFPPENFQHLYAEAAAQGYALTAHAGEEGPASYIRDALDVLKVTRIDHGVRCTEDHALIERLARESVALTVCPLSNVRLRVYERLEQHPLLDLLDRGVAVTVNSDDPAYFGGYLMENFAALESALQLDARRAAQLVRNSIDAAFVDSAKRAELTAALDAYLRTHPAP